MATIENLLNEIPKAPHLPKKRYPLYSCRANIISFLANTVFRILQKNNILCKSDRDLENYKTKGTIGFELREMMEENNISLIKTKEFHDILHILLGCNIKTEGEALIHAFHLGNKSPGTFAYIIFILNIILLPESIYQIKEAHKLGKVCKNVRNINWEQELNKTKGEIFELLALES